MVLTPMEQAIQGEDLSMIGNIISLGDINITDLNDLKTTGLYYVPGSGISNAPTGYAMLIVIGRGNNVSQIFHSVSAQKVFFRSYTSSGWRNWQLVTATDTGS